MKAAQVTDTKIKPTKIDVSFHPTVAELDKATTLFVKMVQKEEFSKEIEFLSTLTQENVESERTRDKKNVLKRSRLLNLDPSSTRMAFYE